MNSLSISYFYIQFDIVSYLSTVQSLNTLSADFMTLTKQKKRQSMNKTMLKIVSDWSAGHVEE